MRKALALLVAVILLGGTAAAQTLDTSSHEAFVDSMKSLGGGLNDEERQRLLMSLIAYAAGAKPGEADWLTEMSKVANDQVLFLRRIQPLNGMTTDELKQAVARARH